MGKRCIYGTCNSDMRYPERLEGGVTFFPFPKPKTKREKCLKWIALCGRPHHQLNVEKINKDTYVCSKHFMDGIGPSEEYPDPLPADSYSRSRLQPVRKKPTKRLKIEHNNSRYEDATERSQTPESLPVVTEENGQNSRCKLDENCIRPENLPEETEEGVRTELVPRKQDSCTQTDMKWVDPIDLLLLAGQSRQCKQEIPANLFCIEIVQQQEEKFKYYTGFSVKTFDYIYKFLVPNDDICPLKFNNHKTKCCSLSLKNQLFFTLCKLRCNLDFTDLSFRFNISQQACSSLFRAWISYMFLRFGEVNIWPHRSIIYENMPEAYKKEFPTTFAIIDCTEIKCQKPSSLKAQSQTYSDYKSSNTLKGLVAVDPRGSVLFSSMLFSGGMSDKEIFVKSGFQDTLKKLIETGHLNVGDSIMADKGFNIQEEVEKVGLKLNIPPFAQSGSQMSQADAKVTKLIAKHRVHVERSIRRIKQFNILTDRVVLSLFSSINQIWYTCCFLTNFMPPCIKYD